MGYFLSSCCICDGVISSQCLLKVCHSTLSDVTLKRNRVVVLMITSKLNFIFCDKMDTSVGPSIDNNEVCSHKYIFLIKILSANIYTIE